MALYNCQLSFYFLFQGCKKGQYVYGLYIVYVEVYTTLFIPIFDLTLMTVLCHNTLATPLVTPPYTLIAPIPPSTIISGVPIFNYMYISPPSM